MNDLRNVKEIWGMIELHNSGEVSFEGDIAYHDNDSLTIDKIPQTIIEGGRIDDIGNDTIGISNFILIIFNNGDKKQLLTVSDAQEFFN